MSVSATVRRGRALLCINGDCDAAVLEQLNPAHFDILIAVDGGLRHAQQLGRIPDYLIGDMDSVAAEAVREVERAGGTVLRYPVEKDATDLELALQYLCELDIDQLELIGISGGRLDHSLANLLLLGQQEWPYAIRFFSADGNGYLISRHRPFAGTLQIGSELSLLALSATVTGVSCQGLYYPLSLATIRLGSTLGISNIVETEQVRVTVESGALLLLHNDRPHAPVGNTNQ